MGIMVQNNINIPLKNRDNFYISRDVRALYARAGSARAV